MASTQYGHYSIRLSDPSEFEALHLGDCVNITQEEHANEGGVLASVPRRRSGRHANSDAATPSTTPTTRRRKRQASLRLSETSPVFLELEKQSRDGSTDADRLVGTCNSMTKFAFVGAIQPLDELESIASLTKKKVYKCSSVNTNVQTILHDKENYPLNLVFVRKPPTEAVPPENKSMGSQRKRKRRNGKKKVSSQSPVAKEPCCISLLSSDEEDDPGDLGAKSDEGAGGDTAKKETDPPAVVSETRTNVVMEDAETSVVVSVDAANAKSANFDASFVARPDPLPGYRADEWVLTPYGPGIVQGSSVNRYADSLNSLVNPVLTYQVILPFGTLFVSSKQVQPFEGSPYANEILVSSSKLSLSRGDVVRLRPGVYLNDNLVNFFLQRLPIPDNKKVYVFSSYLYTRIADLSQGQKRNSPEFHSLLWDNLKGWIKNVNIWEMDMLIIPIHADLHWSVVAVCHPSLLLSTNDTDEERIPCLLHLDSGKRFRLHTSSAVFNRVRTFLQVCLKEQHKIDVNLTKETLKGGSPPVPAQANETDCGLYMLEWVERLLMGGELVVNQDFVTANGNVPPFGKTAFPQALIDEKRHDYQSLIYTLSSDKGSGMDTNSSTET